MWQAPFHSPLPFLSTSPARGTTWSFWRSFRPAIYFYPRPPRGGRQDERVYLIKLYAFLSTSPARGTTVQSFMIHPTSKISIHVPARGTTATSSYFLEHRQISIHVPREGDDSKCDGKYIVFSRNICHNKIQRTKTRCIFVQNATVSAAYPHKYPKNDNRLPVRTVRCFSAHCRFAPEPCRPRRAFLYRCLYTSKISSCAHCGARPTCSTLVLYWLPSR